MTEAMTMPMVESMVDDGTGRAEKPSAVDAAARFVAMQPGGARKILLEHERRNDGTCGGCLTSPVTWPCVVSVIATKALELDPAR
jgi:hypothetical protein